MVWIVQEVLHPLPWHLSTSSLLTELLWILILPLWCCPADIPSSVSLYTVQLPSLYFRQACLLGFGCNTTGMTLEDSVLFTVFWNLYPCPSLFMQEVWSLMLLPPLLSRALEKKDVLCQGSMPSRPSSPDFHTQSSRALYSKGVFEQLEDSCLSLWTVNNVILVKPLPASGPVYVFIDTTSRMGCFTIRTGSYDCFPFCHSTILPHLIQ